MKNIEVRGDDFDDGSEHNGNVVLCHQLRRVKGVDQSGRMRAGPLWRITEQ